MGSKHFRHKFSLKVNLLLNLIVLLLLTGIYLLALPLPATQAKPGFLAGARARYPQLAGSRLDTCNLCHQHGGGSSRNNFGEAVNPHKVVP